MFSFTVSLNFISLLEIITAKFGVLPFRYFSMDYVYIHTLKKMWSFYHSVTSFASYVGDTPHF